jgi:hypothetical protein
MTKLNLRGSVGRALAVPLTLGSVLSGCATGHEPALPTAADYNRSCYDLIIAYEIADQKAQNRKAVSNSTDLALGTATVVLAVTSSIGVGLPLGALALSQLKGDLGAGDKIRQRDELRTLAMRKGCTKEEVDQRRADRARVVPSAQSGGH